MVWVVYWHGLAFIAFSYCSQCLFAWGFSCDGTRGVFGHFLGMSVPVVPILSACWHVVLCCLEFEPPFVSPQMAFTDEFGDQLLEGPTLIHGMSFCPMVPAIRGRLSSHDLVGGCWLFYLLMIQHLVQDDWCVTLIEAMMAFRRNGS